MFTSNFLLRQIEITPIFYTDKKHVRSILLHERTIGQ